MKKQKLDEILNTQSRKKPVAGAAGIALGIFVGTLVPFAVSYQQKQIKKAHNLVNQAEMIKVENLVGARPWHYCKNEVTQHGIYINKPGDPNALWDACVERIKTYPANHGLKYHLPEIYVPDINKDRKASSKH